jgi:hypothetical protein
MALLVLRLNHLFIYVRILRFVLYFFIDLLFCILFTLFLLRELVDSRVEAFIGLLVIIFSILIFR